MSERPSLDEILAGAKRKTAILDTNLLVAYLGFQLGPDVLRKLKRAKPYEREDIVVLANVLSGFRAIVTTSAVLTEASNLANELSGRMRDTWFLELAQFGRITEEAHIPTQVVCQKPELVRFGFTDAVLAQLADTHVLITADFRLAGVLESQHRQVINFNQIQLLRQLADS